MIGTAKAAEGIVRRGWTIIERGRCRSASAMLWLAYGLAELGRGPDAAGGPCLVTGRILPILKMFKTQRLMS